MNGPSSRSRSVGHFLVMEILERAHALESRGQDVIHLEVGEPDFSTPMAAREAGKSAIEAGRTHYTHSLGIRPLREAVAARFHEEYGIDISPERVIITLGSSAALLLAFAVLCDPGDEIVVSDPGYPCYPNIARTLDVVPVSVPVGVGSGFALDPERVGDAIGSKTRGIVVNSPANPTGVITPAETIDALCGLGPLVVSDEIYHGLVYEGAARSVLEFTDDAVVVGGFSKRYAMTGWRLGYLVVPERYIRQVQAMQQNLFISPSDFGQWAALEALKATDDIEEMRQRFDQRRRVLLEGLPTIGLPVPVRPHGAFYVFADASRFSSDSMSFALELLEETKVAVTPGVDFGSRGEGYLRFSYATSLERIEEGLQRLGRFLAAR